MLMAAASRDDFAGNPRLFALFISCKRFELNPYGQSGGAASHRRSQQSYARRQAMACFSMPVCASRRVEELAHTRREQLSSSWGHGSSPPCAPSKT